MDFVKSDLQARAMLIKAAFDLFTIMHRRGIQVSQLLGARSLIVRSVPVFGKLQ